MSGEDSRRSAVVLLSGGLDSATTLAWAAHEGFFCYALTFHYGQRHECELEAAKEIARAHQLGARHRIIRLDPQLFAGSALTGAEPVPLHRDVTRQNEIPATYVPARNTVFLALALAFAEQVGSRDLCIGANAVDFSGYPDCRPEFIAAFENLANRGTKAGAEGQSFHVHAPLLRLTKVQIIQLGRKLGVDYGLTWSCYNPRPGNRPCGACDSCQIRRRAFEQAGTHDPVEY